MRRTLPEFLHAQSTLWRDNMELTLTNSRRLAEISARFADNATRTAAAQVERHSAGLDLGARIDHVAGRQPTEGVAAIGSGGPYALAAARALLRYSDQSAAEIVRNALDIAGDICIYSNKSIEVEELT